MKKNYLFSLVLLIVCMVYIPILGNDILYDWDDQWMVTNHLTMSGWTWHNLWRIFTQVYHSQYSPLTQLNYLTVYTIFKYNAFGYHLASLLWHTGCVCLVYKFIFRLLQIHGKTSEKESNSIALLTALLFGLHPVNVEAVAWISAVKILIYSFFYLAALLFYLRYIQTNKSSDFLVVIILFICSCCGKEQAVTFPLCLILLDWFTNRNLKSKSLWIEKLTFLCIAFFFGMVTVTAQMHFNGQAYPLIQRIVLAGYVFYEYLAKGIFPLNLNYLYPFPMNLGDALPYRFYIYPILVLGLLTYLYTLRQKKILMLGVGLFCVNLLLSLNIIHMSRAAIVADRYFYLSGVGLLFLLAYVLFYLKRKLTNFNWQPRMLIFIYCFYAIYLGGYTYSYSHRWENLDTLKKHMKELLNDRNKNIKTHNF